MPLIHYKQPETLHMWFLYKLGKFHNINTNIPHLHFPPLTRIFTCHTRTYFSETLFWAKLWGETETVVAIVTSNYHSDTCLEKVSSQGTPLCEVVMSRYRRTVWRFEMRLTWWFGQRFTVQMLSSRSDHQNEEKPFIYTNRNHSNTKKY
jgi:hypothetical protein